MTAGCGGSGSDVASTELTSFTPVAQKSAAADSARFALTVEIGLPGSGPLALAAEGGFDAAAKRSHLRLDLSSLAGLFASLGPSLGGIVPGDLQNADDWKLEAIQDGDTVYVRFPPLAKQLPEGKTWIKGDLKDLESPKAGQLSQFGSLAGTDPRDVFAFLEAVSGSIELVGTETIRGAETSHYRATLDPAKLEDLIPAEQRAALGGLGKGAIQEGLASVPLDVWIDAEQRLRKLSIDVDTKMPGSENKIEASIVAEIYDYGAALEVALPAADEVADAATLGLGP